MKSTKLYKHLEEFRSYIEEEGRQPRQGPTKRWSEGKTQEVLQFSLSD